LKQSNSPTAEHFVHPDCNFVDWQQGYVTLLSIIMLVVSHVVALMIMSTCCTNQSYMPGYFGPEKNVFCIFY
jgi:hypothetical protein